MDEEAEPQVVQAQRGDVVGELRGGAQAAQHRARELGPLAVVAREAGDAAVGAHPPRPGLGGVVQQRGEAHRLPVRELVGERLAQQRADRLGVLAEPRAERVVLDRHDLVEHRERVVVDVEVVELVLLHAAQRRELGEDLRGEPVRVHEREAGADGGRGDDLLELAEDPLRRDALEPRRGARHRRRRVRLDRQVEVDREPHGAQRAQRVVVERGGTDHPQPPRVEVRAAAVRVEQVAAGQRLRHRVDGEIARGEVGADVVVAQHDEVDVPGAAVADHAPGAERAGEPERRAAGRARERARRRLGVLRHGEVEVGRRAAEQAVADRAADDPGGAPGEDLARGVERRSRRRPAAVVRPRHARGDPAGDLVVDRREPPRPLLGEHPLAALRAEQHDRRAARRRLGTQIDGDVVHRDRADHRHAAAVHQHVAVVRQRAPDAVPVADRDRPDPGRRVRDETAAVAGALPRRDRLDLGEVGGQLERGRQAVLAGSAPNGSIP